MKDQYNNKTSARNRREMALLFLHGALEYS